MDESPYQLYADLLTEKDRPDLAQLNCGSGNWAKAATEWIQGSDVWESIMNRGTRVWLFRNAQDVLVGYGSLGLTRRKWPPPDGQHANLQIIPMLGLDHHFHGKPSDREWRYSHQVISHLRYEAIATLTQHLTEKRDVYEAAGVGEYLVFETIEGRSQWWRTEDGRFVEIQSDGGIYKSILFPGLWLDADALRSANALKLIETLQRGRHSTNTYAGETQVILEA